MTGLATGQDLAGDVENVLGLVVGRQYDDHPPRGARSARRLR
jgi:hypothetical protein